jgi:maleylacetate reductase
VGYNNAAVPDLLAPLSAVVGSPAGAALYDYAATIRAPQALREIGLREADLDQAAQIAIANPYENPRPFDEASIRNLLQAAWAGDRPTT